MESAQPVRVSGTWTALLVIAAVMLVVANSGKVFQLVFPPRPAVVSQGADDMSSRILEYSVRVWGEVRNDGGNGDVVFEATVSQDGRSWTKTALRRIESKQTARFELVFDEVSLLGSGDGYVARAYPLGFTGGPQ